MYLKLPEMAIRALAAAWLTLLIGSSLCSQANAQAFETTPKLREWSGITSGGVRLMVDNISGTGSSISGTKVRFRVGKFDGTSLSTFSGSGLFQLCVIGQRCLSTFRYSAGQSYSDWLEVTLPSPFYGGSARYAAYRIVSGVVDPNVQTGVVQIDLVPTVQNRPPLLVIGSIEINPTKAIGIRGKFSALDPENNSLRDLKVLLSRDPEFPSDKTCVDLPSEVTPDTNINLPNGNYNFGFRRDSCSVFSGPSGTLYLKARASDSFGNTAESKVLEAIDPGNQQPRITNLSASVSSLKTLVVTADVIDSEGDNFSAVVTISNPLDSSSPTVSFVGRESTANCGVSDCSARRTNGQVKIFWNATQTASFLQANKPYKVRLQVKDDTSTLPATEAISGEVIRSTVEAGGTSVDDVSPKTARLDVPNTFTVTGTGMVNGMSFFIFSCLDQKEEPGGTDTQRRFTCTPRIPGISSLNVRKTAGGAILYPGTVRIEHPVRIGDPAARGVPSIGGVSLFNGNLHLSSVDLSVPGKGLSFALGRSYNSYDWVYEFEHGGVSRAAPWRFSTDLRLAYVAGTDNTRLYVQRPDGSGENYYKGNRGWRPIDIGNQSILRENSNGTITHISRAGVLSSFESPAGLGRLLTQSDRDGNTLTYRYDSSARLSSVTDTSGRIYQFSYDTSGRLSRVADFTGRYVEYTYTAATGGRIKTFRDVRGNVTQYSYNSQDFLQSVIDPRGNTALSVAYTAVRGNTGVLAITTAVERARAGRTCGSLTAFTYCYGYEAASDGSGFSTTVDGPESLSIARVTFDNAGRALASVDAQGGTSTTKYYDPSDADHYANAALVTQRQTPRGVRENYSTQIEVDIDDGLNLAAVNPLSQRSTVSWFRDPAANRYQPATSTTHLQNTTAFGYTATGRLSSLTAPLQRATNGPSTQYGWTDGTLTSITDPLNQRSTLARDAHGNLTSISDPRNTAWVTAYEYDALGRVIKTTDARGGVTLAQYDAAGNPTEVRRKATGLADLVTTNNYDANGNLTSTTDPRGNTVTMVYDAGNRLTETRQLVSGQTVRRLLGYDGASRLVSITNENGNTRFRDYDAAGRVLQERMPLQRTLRFSYDADGRLSTRTDGENRSTSYEYDRLGRVSAVIDPANNTTRYEYDAESRLTKLTDPLGRITEYGYDANGNLSTAKDPAGVVSSAEYDAANRMISRTDPRGQTTRFSYDEAGNLTSMRDPLGNAWGYSYDAQGNQTASTQPDGRTTAYTYDGFNRLVRATSSGGGSTTQVSYSWDGNGNLTQMVDTVGTTSYQYDQASRLIGLTDPFGVTLAYTYDAAGNRKTITYPGNRVVTYAYDAAERMASVTDWTNRTARYTYNLADQITRLQHGNGSTADYSYDAISGRLSSLVNKRPGGEVISSHQHSYDNVGNIVQADEVLPLEPTLTPRRRAWTVDAANRVLKETVSGSSFEHDAAGRLIRQVVDGSTTTFAYNERDLLTGLIAPGRTETYRYNGHGHRLERTVNGSIARYLVEPNANLPNVLAELNSNNVAQLLYVYGARGLLSRIDLGGNYRAYHANPLGSILATSDSAGSIVDIHAYLPYGESFSSNSGSNDFKYIGAFGVRDDGNGILQMRARSFHTNIARFGTLDKFSGTIGQPHRLNRFQYADGNPLLKIDPTGLTPCASYQYAYGLNRSCELSIVGTNTFNLGQIDFQIQPTGIGIDSVIGPTYKGDNVSLSFGKSTEVFIGGIVVEDENYVGIKLGASASVGLQTALALYGSTGRLDIGIGFKGGYEADLTLSLCRDGLGGKTDFDIAFELGIEGTLGACIKPQLIKRLANLPATKSASDINYLLWFFDQFSRAVSGNGIYYK